MFANTPSVPLVSNIGGNGNSWGGDGCWLIWIVLIFALFGFGGFGFGGSGGGNGGVGAEVQRGFDTQAITSKLDGITNGLSDGFYAMNTGLLSGFNGVERAVCDLGYQTQNGFNTTNITLMQAQNALQALIAQCCCETREAIQNVNYNLATQGCEIKNAIQNSTRDIIENANAGTREILGYLCQKENADLRAQVQRLELAASQTAQNQFITQVGSDIVNRLQPVPVPAFPASNLYAYGNGSGCCGNGCGC